MLRLLLITACAGTILGNPVTVDSTAPARFQERSRNTKLEFDGKSAFDFLLKQTHYGPRAPGLPGHESCAKYLLRIMKELADATEPQNFLHTLSDGRVVTLTNIVASFNPNAEKRILISAHWDTRRWADKDPDKKNWEKPISGANDGASGVAVILEIARQLKNVRPEVGVDLVLFDGEDLGKSGHPETFSVGAKYFAANRPEGIHPRFGINIDMVGDRNLTIYREQNSEEMAPDVQKLVFSRAKELGVTQFIDQLGEEITDDHLPLCNAGLPTIDLIDFEYPDGSNKYWHTLEDTSDKCSARSLAAVGKVLLSIIYSQ